MSKYYSIGVIVSTHALKGEVKIYSSTDFSEERYKVGNKLYIEKDKMIEVKVKSHRRHKGFDLVTFEGYENINKVLPFMKCKIYVSEVDIHDLYENEYYYHELYDCSVSYNEKIIGKVIDVVNYGASDILVIKDINNNEIMIPFVDDFIKDVDKQSKKIYIDVIEGLLSNEN